ncbi:MAG TPA: hypothetical protein VFO18_05885 [Methylomirabilota bacterium]|nr:hypothetical protein [Methylomirabilota bacterium]
MGALLGETFRLLAGHLHLFTLISLTVWLPGHVLLNYFRFFDTAEGKDLILQTLRVESVIQLVFDPLVVAATLAVLAHIKQGLPVSYVSAISVGKAAWARLLVVRFVINAVLWLPALGWLAVRGAAPGVAVLGGLLVLALTVVIVIVLIRYAVVDAVVVLEGGTALTAWRRAAALTAGRRGQIFWTVIALFVLIFGALLLVSHLFKVVPALDHFVVRVLVDCALAVSQSLVTIALFLVYWRAAASTAPDPVPAA